MIVNLIHCCYNIVTMTNIPLNIDKWLGSFKSIHKPLDELAKTNYRIWGYEDDARRTDVPDSKTASLKRSIDKDNQKRNDLIDTIDVILKQDIEKKVKSIDGSAPLNSETPGSILDRIIILALRSHSLKKEIERKDATESHIKRCKTMLDEVEERSQDLAGCLEKLLEDCCSGKKRLKSYKQHKLYNDPDLNPSLRK